MLTSRLAVSSCPICEQGLRLIRACGLDHGVAGHGLVICDECEAIWTQPSGSSKHVFADPETPECPVCSTSLWDGNNRWATVKDAKVLGWFDSVDPELVWEGDSGATTGFQEDLSSLLASDVDPVTAGVTLKRLADDSSPPVAAWVHFVARQSLPLADADPAVIGGLLRLFHVKALSIKKDDDVASPLLSIAIDDLAELLTRLPAEFPNRHLMMQLMAMRRDEASLGALLVALRQSPPRGWMAAGLVLSPLMQHSDWPTGAVFPDLLDLIDEASLASPILDLASFLFRSGRVNQHPASERVDSLNELLRAVAGRLGRFEEDPRSFGDDIPQIQAILNEAVALAVSLCDALGLIGDESSSVPLHQTLELKHRRVQCEAAGALARLGLAVGRERLTELAAEPSARLRAIAYADELDMGELIDPKYREPSATAEAEMSLWLSQPQQMGVPPTHVETVDSKRLLWPSFHDPVDVTLVRYEYSFGERSLSNVGMTGPAVFSLACDVADLPPEDIYAVYAGWHVQHEHIFSVPSTQFNAAQLKIAEQLAVHLHRANYEDVHPKLLGFFLDETAGIYAATRNGTACLVATDGLETMEWTVQGRPRPPSPEDLFHLYKGRKMLRSFNSEDVA